MGIIGHAVTVRTQYHVECHGPDGQLKWVDDCENLVVNAGLNDLLDKRFKGSAYTASDFIGLTDGAPTIAAGDTMASHAGWVEVTDYTGNRKAFTPGSVSGGSVSNTASPAVFAIDDTATVGGAFLDTDASGTSGTLYGAAAFSGGDRAVANGDTLTVTCTLSVTAS